MQNYEARKRLLEYDDVMNNQREVIYDLRLFALEGGEDLRGEVWDMVEQALRDVIAEYAPEGEHPEAWDLYALRQRLVLDYFLVVEELPAHEGDEHEFEDSEAIEDLVVEAGRVGFKRKLESWAEHRERILAWVMLGVIDEKWRDHLYDLDHLKASIGFRGWGQKDPLIEYKQEAYTMFVDLMADLRKSVSTLAFRAQLAVPQPRPQPPRKLTLSGPSETPDTRPRTTSRPAEPPPPADALSAAMTGARRVGPQPGQGEITNRGETPPPPAQPASSEKTVGRNDPCPCGSGRTYKKCHGAGTV
jgi:preprotein translocase subunit SecA